MLRLLDRYILADMLRVIGLTTVVLVTVIAFGASIKPLSDNVLLSAQQTAKYLVLIIVPMLQFALPFAAGFGATISFHRLTSDNEILAMAVSGRSYRRILLPVVSVGILLALVMVLLTQAIIPRFWGLIEQTLATDITSVFRASIERGETFKLGGKWQIYADELIAQDMPGDDGGPQSRLILLHVAAAEQDDQGHILQDITANQAVLDVYRRDGRTYLKLQMADAVAFDATSGRLAALPVAQSKVLMLPSSLSDEPKAMTRRQLLALRENPDAYADVIEARVALAQYLQELTARQIIDQHLLKSGQIELVGSGVGGQNDLRIYQIKAQRLQGNRFVPVNRGLVEVVVIEHGQPAWQFTTASAQITPVISADPLAEDSLAYDLTLESPTILNLREGGVNQRPRITVPSLTLPDAPLPELSEWSSQQLIEHVQTLDAAGPELQRRVEKVKKELWELSNEIRARLMARHALSATAALLLLLGATLAMWMRGSLPLTIYLWAFLPSILDLILISAGEQLMRDGRSIGPYIMWSGNGVLALVLAVAYARLAKN